MATFTGTSADDVYLSTTEGDRAFGLGGNDTLVGNIGRDTLNGGDNNDLLLADRNVTTFGGNDTLFGDAGNDTLVGARFGFSNDVLVGNADSDLLIASTYGGNTLLGGQGDDIIYGSFLNGSVMNGNEGDDLLVAGFGNDYMQGGGGNDTLVAGIGNNDLFGGDGADEFQFLSIKENTLSVSVGGEQILRSDGGFGGSDTIHDFSTDDRITLAELDRNTVVTFATNALGATVITIAGTANGQAANQTIAVADFALDRLLAPGAQLFSINGSFITTANTANTDGSSSFIVGAN